MREVERFPVPESEIVSLRFISIPGKDPMEPNQPLGVLVHMVGSFLNRRKSDFFPELKPGR